MRPRTKGKKSQKELKVSKEKIPPTDVIKSLGIWIDHHLNFKIQCPNMSPRVRENLGWLTAVARRKGVSPITIDNLTATITLTTLPFGSEIWWTGTPHIITKLEPTNHQMASVLTGLPHTTRIQILLVEAGLPPLKLLRDTRSQRYRIRILISKKTPPMQTDYTAGNVRNTQENGRQVKRHCPDNPVGHRRRARTRKPGNNHQPVHDDTGSRKK